MKKQIININVDKQAPTSILNMVIVIIWLPSYPKPNLDHRIKSFVHRIGMSRDFLKFTIFQGLVGGSRPEKRGPKLSKKGLRHQDRTLRRCIRASRGHPGLQTMLPSN